MTLEKGQRLGPYEIEKPIGAGGMGEVYRAKDTRLDRTVAIKVLPERTAMNADLRARFEREAKAISSLNHPHICTLHDVGHHEGTDFLVMEHLEGEVLSQRLKRGAMDVGEGLEIASQIADALAAAHGQGLVHRDLKPDNMFLTKEGAKLLDFGLAKLQMSEGIVEGMTGVTQTTPLTGKGTIVGTLHYMSPEQLEGKEADERSDVFSFGATLYEMITGRRAFEGESQANLIAAVLDQIPPPISEVKPKAPPGLVRLVSKCIEKDPDRRWQSARDLADELRWITQSGSQAGVSASVSGRRRYHLRLSWTVAAVALASTLLFAALHFSRTEPNHKTSRLAITSEQEFRGVAWPRISPDGQLLAFLARDSLNTSSIWIRPLNSLEGYRLVGTENARRPFWSPDSRHLAFFTDAQQLKKIPVAGGSAQLICEHLGFDGSWGSDGTILFDGSKGPIMQVPATGGSPTPATIMDENSGEQYHGWPYFLPDGKHFLYLTSYDLTVQGEADRVSLPTHVGIGSLDGSVDIKLFRANSRVEYCAPGYIMHCRDGVLLAQRLDIGSLTIVGDPIPLAENVLTWEGNYQHSVSDEGTLVYSDESDAGHSQIIAVDRAGRELDTIDGVGQYWELALSPDGRRLAFVRLEQSSDIWIHQLDRKLSSRLTFSETWDIFPVWSPNGERLAYGSYTGSTVGIFVRSAGGMGDSRQVYSGVRSVCWPTDWSPDGRHLSVTALQDSWNIYFLNMIDSADAQAVLTTPHNEQYGMFSPDGNHLAYQSDESGRYEIFVRDLGEAGGKRQISFDGGLAPKWRADGEELYFWDPDNYLVAVPVEIGSRAFEIGQPQRLFQRTMKVDDYRTYRYYDVAGAGDLFYLSVAVDEAREARFNVVLNWDAELER